VILFLENLINKPGRSQEARGVITLCISSVFFSLFSLTGKAISNDISTSQMVLVRSAIILPLLIIWALKRGQPIIGKKKGLLLLRGILGTCGLFTYFYALKRLPLGDTVLIFQAHPIVVAFLAPFILKESTRMIQWILIIVSFIGVALVVGPTGAGSWEGRISALLCCVIAGTVYITLRYLRRTEGTLTIAIAFPAVSLVFLLPAFFMRIPGFEWTAPSPWDWFLLIAMSFAALGGQVLLTLGIGKVRAARGTAISNLQIAFALIFGVIFFSEIPSWITLCGGAVIVAAQFLLASTRDE